MMIEKQSGEYERRAKRFAAGVLMLCLAMSWVICFSCELGAVTQKKNVAAQKKNMATQKKKKSTQSGTSSKSKSKAKVHGGWRQKHVRWLPSPKLNVAKRVELMHSMDAELNDAGSGSLENEKALGGFFRALDARLSGVAQESGSQTVRVLQFGDSHTAADVFSGEARRVIQEKFGNGGIGFAYAGHPFAGYRVFGSSHGATNGWTTSGNHFLNLGDGRTGLGGLSVSTDRANESVSLDAPCATLELEYLAQPGGGTLTFTDNGTPMATIDTDAETIGAGSFTYQCPAGEHHFAAKTESNQPVTLLGWVATNAGATWEALGINGAEAPLILKWDQALFSEYLKSNDPALIVLAYGTNEAISTAWDEASYAERFGQLVDTLHGYVPGASILVMGPADHGMVSHRAWKTDERTDKIIAAQKKVCERHNCAFWNWRERMGGLGAMQDWVSVGWAQGDHTHFTTDGYRALADAFMLDLLTSYNEYRTRAAGHTSENAGADVRMERKEGAGNGRAGKDTQGTQGSLGQGSGSGR